MCTNFSLQIKFAQTFWRFKTTDFKLKSIEGSSEIDLVRSGLEDTMLETYKVISDVWNKHSEIPDLRTAAMIVAVKRIAQSYNSLGI